MTKTQRFARHDYEPLSAEEVARYEILESINSLIVVLDEELTTIHANDQWRDFVDYCGIPVDITGVRYLELLLETQLLLQEQIADISNIFQDMVADTIQDFDLYYLIHSYQKRRRLKIHAELFRVEDRIRLLICHDISDETYTASQEKTDIIQLMIGGASHNVNKLLVSIKGNCELMKAEIQSNIRANTILMRIFDSINSAPQLTEKFLLYSQATETGLEEVHLSEVIYNVIDSLRQTLPLTTKVQTQFDRQKYIVRAEEIQLCQILMHILDNSAYAIAGKAGCISVTLQQSIDERKITDDESDDPPSTNKVAHIRIEDDGFGMNEETLEHCFEPFYTTKPFGYSNGLGLSMVRQVVINLGGRIIVRSNAGAGTVFDIYLPCAKIVPAPSSHLA